MVGHCELPEPGGTPQGVGLSSRWQGTDENRRVRNRGIACCGRQKPTASAPRDRALSARPGLRLEKPERQRARQCARQSREVIAHQIALSSVQTATYIKIERTHSIKHGDGTANGAERRVESGKEPVAGGVDLATAILLQHVANLGIECLQQVPRCVITQRGSALGRAFNIGEQHGGKHQLEIARKATDQSGIARSNQAARGGCRPKACGLLPEAPPVLRRECAEPCSEHAAR